MEVLCYSKFRKVSLSLFLLFPNVNRITISKKNNEHFLELWKKNIKVNNLQNQYINVNYTWSTTEKKRKTGMFCSIPLTFFGYDSVDQKFEETIGLKNITRFCFRLNSKNKKIDCNSVNWIKKRIDNLEKHLNINSIEFRERGHIVFYNKNNNSLNIPMSGSGITTVNYNRYIKLTNGH